MQQKKKQNPTLWGHETAHHIQSALTILLTGAGEFKKINKKLGVNNTYKQHDEFLEDSI